MIEMLVVLVLAGLLTALVLPGMQNIERNSRYRTERDAILGRLDELGYEAFLTGQAITLSNSPAGVVAAGTNYPIKMPQGWRLRVASPVVYAFNGICSGGKVILLAPDQTREEFVLKAPVCRVRERVAN